MPILGVCLGMQAIGEYFGGTLLNLKDVKHGLSEPLFAINESGHNSTAEVRMSDVVNPDDSDIYRNLAGGVTAIQLLHGSANPIGGQSAVMKLKWGAPIDEMVIKDKKFIKFALGEKAFIENGKVAAPTKRKIFMPYYLGRLNQLSYKINIGR